MNTKEKYTVDDFKGLQPEERKIQAMVAIANELHNIYSALWEIKEKRKN